MKLSYIFVIILVIALYIPCAGTPNANKVDMRWCLSIPYVNSFRIVPENEGAKINTGFWGIAAGVDYYHSERQYLNLGTSAVMDFFLPVLMATDPSFADGSEERRLNSVYFALSNNHRIKMFTVGYGLSYAVNFWSYSYYNYSKTPDLPPTKHINKKHGALGLIFPTYVSWDNVGAGVVYRPTFFRPNLTDKFIYEHLISIEFTLRRSFFNAKKELF